MSLLEIKRYLMQVKMTNLTSLAQYFKCDPEVLRGMLSHFLRKGWLCQLRSAPACGRCTGCPSQPLEIYQWVA